jgi:hypothetical protein
MTCRTNDAKRRFSEDAVNIYASRAIAFARGFLPDDARGGAEAERRALTTLLFVSVFFTQAPLFAGFYWLIGAPHASVVVALAGPLAVLSVPLLMRRSVRAGSNALVFILWAAFVAISALTDGQRSGALFWLAALPVVATLTTNGRDPVVWLVASPWSPPPCGAMNCPGGCSPSSSRACGATPSTCCARACSLV